MKAQPGRQYAQIVQGRCNWVFTQDMLPEWNPEHFEALDVTGSDVRPGDLWDGAGWTRPAPPPPPDTVQPRIEAAEKGGLRAMREVLLAVATQALQPNDPALQRLEQLEAEIAALRAQRGRP